MTGTFSKALSIRGISAASIILFSAIAAPAQENDASLNAFGIPKDKTLSVTAEFVADRLEQAFVAAAAKYIDALTFVEGIDYYVKSKTEKPDSNFVGLYRYTPSLDLKSGKDGSFQSIVGKFSGETMFSFIKRGLADGTCEIDLPTLHVVPFALGFETTRFVEQVAVLGEVGYIPYRVLTPHSCDPVSGRRNLVLGINPRFGAFLQAGYKFNANGQAAIGGSADQSSEPANDYILRMKADFRLVLEDLVSIPIHKATLSADVITWATGWYDIAHSDWYHSVGATLRVNLPGDDTKHLDFTIEDGSGEPNFNKGSQFSAGLTVTF